MIAFAASVCPFEDLYDATNRRPEVIPTLTNSSPLQGNIDSLLKTRIFSKQGTILNQIARLTAGRLSRIQNPMLIFCTSKVDNYGIYLRRTLVFLT
jgi:hypothetical protein